MIIIAAVVMALASLACFYRVLVGPTVPDRMAALDVTGLIVAMIMVLLATHFRYALFFDIVLVYSALLFADVMIMAKYLEHKELYK